MEYVSPAGWYPHPATPNLLAYWDGYNWTGHTHHVANEPQQAVEATPSGRVMHKLQREESKVRKAEVAKQKKDDAAVVSAERAEERLITEAAAIAEYEDYWQETLFRGAQISGKAAATIQANSSPGERPWFVLGAGIKGVLVAFDDRLVIVKVGVYTSYMAGALGGGRITSFPFTDITGIEYNGQMLTGVLEILTPSYQGTANKDYWKGATKGRNSDSNDPWTLSNCLPLNRAEYNALLPVLNQIRERVSAAKNPRVHMVSPAVQTVSVADEIQKLSVLRADGHLSEQEFVDAKRSLIGGNA